MEDPASLVADIKKSKDMNDEQERLLAETNKQIEDLVNQKIKIEKNPAYGRAGRSAAQNTELASLEAQVQEIIKSQMEGNTKTGLKSFDQRYTNNQVREFSEKALADAKNQKQTADATKNIDKNSSEKGSLYTHDATLEAQLDIMIGQLNSVITLMGGTPVSQIAFGPPSSAEAFGPPSSAEAFGPPSSAEAFGPPSSAEAFGPPSSAEAFGPPSPNRFKILNNLPGIGDIFNNLIPPEAMGPPAPEDDLFKQINNFLKPAMDAAEPLINQLPKLDDITNQLPNFGDISKNITSLFSTPPEDDIGLDPDVSLTPESNDMMFKNMFGVTSKEFDDLINTIKESLNQQEPITAIDSLLTPITDRLNGLITPITGVLGTIIPNLPGMGSVEEEVRKKTMVDKATSGQDMSGLEDSNNETAENTGKMYNALMQMCGLLTKKMQRYESTGEFGTDGDDVFFDAVLSTEYESSQYGTTPGIGIRTETV